jgi:hypothetical protein
MRVGMEGLDTAPLETERRMMARRTWTGRILPHNGSPAAVYASDHCRRPHVWRNGNRARSRTIGELTGMFRFDTSGTARLVVVPSGTFDLPSTATLTLRYVSAGATYGALRQRQFSDAEDRRRLVGEHAESER